MGLYVRNVVRMVTEVLYLSNNNNKLLTMVLGPLIVPLYMNFRVVYVENKSMNKVFNTKSEDIKLYKCHVNASERSLWTGHNTREEFVGSGNFQCGANISERGTLIKYRERLCFGKNKDFFVFFAMSPNVKKDELEAAAQSTLNRTDTEYQKGL